PYTATPLSDSSVPPCASPRNLHSFPTPRSSDLVHHASHIADKPLVTVSCPSLSRELLESELFGHVRGSFTGAVRDHWGKVKAAEDRKSTRLNSSHVKISYAVFCLKKKNLNSNQH